MLNPCRERRKEPTRRRAKNVSQMRPENCRF